MPQLHLKSLQVGLEDHQLKEMAYTVFLGCARVTVPPALAAVMRAQLEISEQRAAELARIVALVAQQGITSLATLEMHVKLLQVVRPSAFDSFKNFVWWRETVTSAVWLILSQATRDHWTPAPADAVDPPSARSLLARLRGGLRRLDVREADEFDEGEYTEAAEAVFVAAGKLAEHCATGWGFPWGLRARMAELMLRGVFDTLEEGQYVDGHEDLLALLKGNVWPELGIAEEVHSAIYGWVHYRQYCLSGELHLLDAAKLTVQLMKPVVLPTGAANGNGAAVGNQPPLLLTADETDAQFPEEVLACISEAVCARLSDYHVNVPEPRAMKGLLEVLEACEKVRGQSAQLQERLEGCIAASVEAQFGRAAEEVYARVHVDEDRIVLLAAATGELLRVEHGKFSPLLLPFDTAARGVAARTLHELFGARMLPWLISVNGLTKAALEAIRCSQELEEVLRAEMTATEFTPWGTMERLQPLLYTWVQGQVSMLKGWQSRIMAQEDWKRLNKQRSGGARSVVETIKIVTETLEALFDMRLPVPAGVVRALAEGLDGAMQLYCEFILNAVGSAEALVPPEPPLTRYKRELAVAAEQFEEEAYRMAAQGNEATLAQTMASAAAKLKQGQNASWLQPLGQTEEERRVLGIGYDKLVVMLNSVQHLIDSFVALEKMVVERWDDGRPRSARAKEGLSAYDWLPGMFDGAKHTAAHVRDQVCRFLAMKLVFTDLRDVIFERLYRFHVQSARLELVLQEVDRHLGDICSRVHDALPPRLARAVLQALVLALQQVLLNGGPYRLFSVGDSELLEADLSQMRAMFYADGEGLPLADIDAICRPLSDLLDVMQLDTGLVMANLRQARPPTGSSKQLRPAPSMRPGMAMAMDPEILLRVLCHRADHAASKFLKKDFKVSKKIPGTITQTVSKGGGLFGKKKS